MRIGDTNSMIYFKRKYHINEIVKIETLYFDKYECYIFHAQKTYIFLQKR